jgi:opine dehydrogenase
VIKGSLRNRIAICVCGGGNLGHALSAVLGANSRVEVRLLTRRPGLWCREVRLIYRGEAELLGRITRASDRASDVIPGAHVVLLTVPSFARQQVLRVILPFLERSAWVGSLPGAGGFDWVARKELGARFVIFGSTRSPFNCRVIESGISVRVSGVVPQLEIGVLPSKRAAEVAILLGQAMQMRIKALPNYLPVNLTPSNPVVHACRLYAMLKTWRPGVLYRRIPLFYEEWDDAASVLLFDCWGEILSVCRRIPLDLTSVPTIEQHYRVTTVPDLSARIRGLPSLAGYSTPMCRDHGGYIPDFGHRFFAEDISIGLAVIESVARLARAPTPRISEIVRWGKEFAGLSISLPLPYAFGITSAAKLARRAVN